MKEKIKIKDKLKSKRSIKTIILTLIIIISITGMILTMNYAKNNISTNVNNQNETKENGTIPPNMNKKEQGQENNDTNSNNSTNSQEKKSNTTNNKTNEPPAKPEEKSTNDKTQEPPAKPNENSTNSSSQEQSTNQNEENNSINEQKQNPQNNENSQNNTNNLNTKYYVLFAIESLILSSAIIYLIMSKFNKKTIKETYHNKDKIIIAILSLIILTYGFTYLDTKITTDYLLNTNTQTSSTAYSASKEITQNTKITSGKYKSNKKDENAILVSGNIKANISNIKVTKSGDSDGGDNTSFYGTNSGIIAKGGANLVLKNITVNTKATGANGVFSYGGSATTNNSSSDNTTVTISNSTINTTKDNSGGIMTTGGGTMKASNLTINTAGTSSAAIRTDRGGGTVKVDGGTYTTTGKGSPTIYSTANVKVSNAQLTSKTSEGIVIEGKNSVTLENCNLVDNNTKLNGQSTTYKNIFLYQSMSGDAANGNATFTSKNSTITTNNGDSFYVTNTTAKINLENNTITNNDTKGNFLRIQKDSWGNTGSNGGNVTLTMTKQKALGNIVVDSLSTLDMTIKSNSYYEGTINNNNKAKTINLKLDKTSKIKLTGNSYITSLDNEDTSNSNIDFNGYKLYINGVAINK